VTHISPSRTGKPTAHANGVRLHSAYDPQTEAARFVQRSLTASVPGTVVVLGASLGYIADAVAALHPGAKIVPIYYSRELRPPDRAPDARGWAPEDGVTPAAFLARALDELDVEGLTVLEWPPSARAFPELARRLARELAVVVQRRAASLQTVRHFGRRALANAAANAVHAARYVRLSGGGPVVIAASGPSLAAAAEALRRVRGRVRLWALPSSLAFLLMQDLVPDLVVSTDPGYYASLHLHRIAHGPEIPVAMPLTAARGIWRTPSPVHLIHQGTPVERAVAGGLGVSATPVPENGTVAGTALELALALGHAPVVFAGLDLCQPDVQAHVRPHSFGPLFRQAASRLDPLLSILYDRAAESAPTRRASVRVGRALETYAAWFETRLQGRNLPVYRMNPSPVSIPAFRELRDDELPRLVDAAGSREAGAARGRTAPATEERPVPEPARRQLVARFLSETCCDLEGRRKGWLHRPESVFEPTPTLQLLYVLEPVALTEIRRALRNGNNGAAGQQVEEMVTRSVANLQDLHQRLERHADGR
jgi:hypothetical protein